MFKKITFTECIATADAASVVDYHCCNLATVAIGNAEVRAASPLLGNSLQRNCSLMLPGWSSYLEWIPSQSSNLAPRLRARLVAYSKLKLQIC